MKINRTADAIHVTLTAEEAEAVRDDLGQIRADKVSAGGDQLHSLLESVTVSDEEQPAAGVCGKCKKPFDPADTAFDGRAQYAATPYCRGCVDRCRDTEIADHRCVICG
ncbi:hypothetical protein ACGFY9_14075 [Streptomyces sp. NPDC048504]|uniref:hypothetical protein n=1 Tax=Streptomyces sp. NPDC048504 TaxID=3365559 RepID=UPI0037218E52